MKFWAQSFLVGVPRIVVGFRDDEGIVNSLQTFKTTDIPNETQVYSHMLQACNLHSVLSLLALSSFLYLE